MHQAANDRLELETRLRKALRDDEIQVEYQPVVALQTGRVVAVEALVRWRPEGSGELLPSSAFISVAEDSGLMVPIGASVLRQACRQLRTWRDELGPRAPVMITVNLSARQVRQPDLVEMVARELEASDLTPERLELELNEGVLQSEGDEGRRRLAELRALGVRLAIDDFGSGSSSLAALRQLQVDTVKIDRSSVAALTSPDEGGSLTSAIVRLAQTLDLQVVAEGIETREQLRLLTELRCPLGQGLLLAAPMPAEKLGALLSAGVLPGWRPAGRR
jgi:EAL domain-containing protein (putative c-di-GMP-specific phosphodiesterase class I)